MVGRKKHVRLGKFCAEQGGRGLRSVFSRTELGMKGEFVLKR